VRQQNSGAVEDFILPYSAVYLRRQKWKNYWNRSTFAKVIVKIKVAPFLMAHGVVRKMHGMYSDARQHGCDCCCSGSWLPARRPYRIECMGIPSSPDQRRFLRLMYGHSVVLCQIRHLDLETR